MGSASKIGWQRYAVPKALEGDRFGRWPVEEPVACCARWRTMHAQTPRWMVREVERHCVVRDANEARERANVNLAPTAIRGLLQCECDDPACLAQVSPTHAEYEAVRASGSQFLIAMDHENPENACVLSEGPRYAVVDVVVDDARYAVRAQNPRHSWVERRAVHRDEESPGGLR